jgi:hypothetical protein
MIRVAILIFTPGILSLLGAAAGWWADKRPILGALMGITVGIGIAMVTVADEILHRRRP